VSWFADRKGDRRWVPRDIAQNFFSYRLLFSQIIQATNILCEEF